MPKIARDHCLKCGGPLEVIKKTGTRIGRRGCKPCRAASTRRSKQDPVKRAKYKKSQKEWKVSNPDKVRSHKKADYDRHRDRYREMNKIRWANMTIEERMAERREQYLRHRDHEFELQARWRKNNPDAYLVYQHRRRARKIGNGGSHTTAEWQAVIEAQSECCIDCGCVAKLTRGHLLPISRGGSDNISNIVGQCRPCNSRQGAKIHALAREEPRSRIAA